MTESPQDRRVIAIAAVLLGLVAALCYRNSLQVPMLFDDLAAITGNASIRHLEAVGRVLTPPPDATTAGRPLLNLSFALNYAAGGEAARGYHIANVAILILGGLVLFGIVRRTLQGPGLKERCGGTAIPLAWLCAMAWTVHPLLTESVTYLSQRAESLMGLFYLLTLYAFIRGGRGWTALSVAACFAGMATKEGMATAPLAVLLYDRAYLSASFRGALARRKGFYPGLAASWILLAFLMAQSRLGARGVGMAAGLPWWRYPLTETWVVLHYLKLAVWPAPLVFDYGSELLNLPPAACIGPAAAIAALLLAVLLAWRRSPRCAYPAVWVFLTLAPSSSVVPVALQPMAESRMFLPLAGLVCLVGLLAYAAMRRAALVGLLVATVVLAVATTARNRDYRSAASLWADTVRKVPGSSRAHNNLALALVDLPGQLPAALEQYRAALRLRPDFPQAQCDYGNALLGVQEGWREAIQHYRTALRVDPRYAPAEYDLATVLAVYAGKIGEAVSHYEAALALDPDYAEAHNNLANLLMRIPGRANDALAHFRRAVYLKPDYAEARNNLANRLAADRATLPEAVGQYEAALRIRPDAQVETNLGVALARLGRSREAVSHWRTALALDPNNAAARRLLRSAGVLPSGPG